MYDIIDIGQWKRKDLFTFFKSYDNPTWDLVCEINITSFYKKIKEIDAPFFLSFLHVATSVCNSIEELRCRIDQEGNVRRYHIIHPSSTILYDNGTYGFAYFNFQIDFHRFIEDASKEVKQQKERQNVDPKDEDLARIYFSPIPWVSFSGFRHPYRAKGNLSVPMIVFGKHYEKGGERVLSVGLTLHHGLADGYHAGLFFTQLQDKLNHPETFVISRNQ